jgi:hypothetical protein
MTAHHPELDRRFAALRDAAADWTPPASIDAAVAAAAARAARRPRRVTASAPRAWIVAPLALAASIALVAVIVRTLSPHAPEPAPAAATLKHPTFTPVVPMTAIADTPDAYVVSARVPRMTFAQFGVPIDPARADVPVDAELLVRRDGALLAYRFVN